MNWKKEVKEIAVTFTLCILASLILNSFIKLVVWQQIIIIVVCVLPINHLIKVWRAGKKPVKIV